MEDKKRMQMQEEIYSKSLRCGRRTYFFDVRSTKAEDYYLTITESKRYFNEDGSPYYKKHKIYLYKEDFKNFSEYLNEITDYIITEKGEEIINAKQTEDITNESLTEETSSKDTDTSTEETPAKDSTENTDEVVKEKGEDSDEDDKSKFTNVNFEDI